MSSGAPTMLKTGVPGLDEILGGGIVTPSLILIAGNPGTGKTTLAGQIMYYWARNYKLRGLYVTLNEEASELKMHFKRLGMDFEELERAGLVNFLELMPGRGEALEVAASIKDFAAGLEKYKPGLLVIDSLTSLISQVPSQEARHLLFLLRRSIKRAGATGLLLVEVPMLSRTIGLGVEEFIADGLILLEHVPIGNEMVIKFVVIKMRAAAHSRAFYRAAITDRGFEILGPLQ